MNSQNLLDSITIKKLENNDLIKKANALKNKVFKDQTWDEYLTYFGYKYRNTMIIKALMKLSGVKEIVNYGVAVDKDDNAVGTYGLYKNIEDADEAVWFGWFCVDPSVRRRGIGTKILTHSIDLARKTGSKYFRLYTFDRPEEANAQILYEKFGFKIIKKQKESNRKYVTIYRELQLKK